MMFGIGTRETKDPCTTMGQQRSSDREAQEAAPIKGNEKRFVGDDNPLL